MRQFKTDVMHWKDYDFTVINDKIELCYDQILGFIKKRIKSKKKINYDTRFIKDHIKKLIN